VVSALIAGQPEEQREEGDVPSQRKVPVSECDQILARFCRLSGGHTTTGFLSGSKNRGVLVMEELLASSEHLPSIPKVIAAQRIGSRRFDL
jgi:hypothetical protein